MKFVLDTSIIIDKLRGGDRWDSFLASISSGDVIYLPSIVAFELFLGISSRRKIVADKIEGFRKYVRQVDLTWGIARRAAEICRDWVKDIDAADYIIAATAIEVGAQVVTLNKKHFQKIPGIGVWK